MSDVDDYFEGKSETYRIFKAVEEQIAGLGQSERTVRSQMSV